MPDPNITRPIELRKLNDAIGKRVLSIRGDEFISVKQTGADSVAISLNRTALLLMLPQLVGIFKLAGSATKPGMYTAHPLKPPTAQPDPTSSSQLADTDFGVSDTSVTVYLENVREVAVAGHALSTSSTPDLYIGILRGFHTDGKPIYAIDECQ